jgi:multidrug resistance protein, MATE family
MQRVPLRGHRGGATHQAIRQSHLASQEEYAGMSQSFSIRTSNRSAWLREFHALTALGGPLALTNLAQIAMSATDVMMMGKLGPETVAAGALGANLYFVALIIGIGGLNVVAPMIARERGSGNEFAGVVRKIVQQGCLSAFCIAVPCWCLLWLSEPLLRAMGQDAALSALAATYVHTLQWALLPAWCYLVLRSFVSALQRPAWALLIGISAVLVNAVANWCFMLGHCGCQRLGIAGSGLATLLSSLLMFVALGFVVCLAKPFRGHYVLAGFWRPDWMLLRRLWRLGVPMAAALSFEVTMFNTAVFLMGLIGSASLAAHAIAIQVASLTFMVPLGIGQAVTVRVGHAYGAQDPDAIRRAGWAAFAMASAFMAAMSLVIILAPHLLISAFLDTADPANAGVVNLAISFLMFAALFQIADGAQAVGSGMLRGLQDTRVPMLYALTGYWGIGLPLGMLLAFPFGFNGVGIWMGLSVGLCVVAILMVRRWMRREALGLLLTPR